MYYPSLTRLKSNGVAFEVIDKLDDWLGTLKGYKRRGIRPARFAADTGVDYSLANELFCMAAIELRLLVMNYEIYCPHCGLEMVKSVHSVDDIPESLRCTDCGELFNPYEHDEYIEITFDLIEYPDPSSPKKKNTVAAKTSYYKKMTAIPKSKGAPLTANKFLGSALGQEEIRKLLFKPDWDAYDKAYERFKNSLPASVSTEEKGKALEELSCLLLSFITFFKVDPTVHTLTNQIDVTVTSTLR